MSGTKFMVIKLKELIKTAIFAILGVIIIIGLIYFFLPKSDRNAIYEPGVYKTEFTLDGEAAQMEITVDSKKIKSVSLVNTSEALPVFYPLAETTANEIGKEIVKNQSLEVSVAQENVHMAKLLLDAVGVSLEEAKIKK